MKRYLFASLCAALFVGPAAHGQDTKPPYRSVAYDDPYFTKTPAPTPTPTFTPTPRAPRTPQPLEYGQGRNETRPVATPAPMIARAAPALPTQTPRAAPQPSPRPPLRATASQQASLGSPKGSAPAGRLMRGRIEATTGLSLTRGAFDDEALNLGSLIGADRVVAHLGGGAVFLGAYGAISFPGTKASDTATSSDGTTSTERTVTLSEGRELDLGVRLGWATDQVAVYGSAALLNARRETEITTRVSTNADAPTEATESLETYRDGWRVGLGTEVSLPADLYLRAAYDYADLGEDETRHQIMTGLGLRF